MTNGGFLDSNTADGMRQVLADEFSAIYVLNLRGNQRTAGEQSRREGGKIFGSGSRATVAVTMLVKHSDKRRPATIAYHDIGDYLSREEKLRKVAEAGSMAKLPMMLISSNAAGDWLNQRTEDFNTFLPIGDKDRPESGIFTLYSGGLKSGRDAWAYNFDKAEVVTNLQRTIDVYEAERARWNDEGAPVGADFDSFVESNPKVISWNRGLKADARRNHKRTFRPEAMTTALYRPFCRHYVYFDRRLNDTVHLLERIFPTREHQNVGFYVINPGADKPFSALMTDRLPDMALFGSNAGQFFARWRYEPVEEGDLFPTDEPDVVDGYRRVDNITDTALRSFQDAYGDAFSKDDAFLYVYGLLHSADYRQRYAADLRRALPRIPLVKDPQPYIDAGRALSDLHLGYADIEPADLGGLEDGPSGPDRAAFDYYRVDKMRFGRPTAEQKAAGVRADRSTVVLNPRVTLTGIPEEAYRYTLGSRSAIEWVMERYQVKTDATSGIVNDPNAWARAEGDPRFIPTLLARVVNVSLQTARIVASFLHSRSSVCRSRPRPANQDLVLRKSTSRPADVRCAAESSMDSAPW